MGLILDFDLFWVLAGLVIYGVLTLIIKWITGKMPINFIYKGIFVSYLIILFMATFCPIPIGRNMVLRYRGIYGYINGGYYNLIPFGNLFDAIQFSKPIIPLLKEMVKNIILFLPLGYLYNYTFREKSFNSILLCGFSLSLIIEIMQFVYSKFIIQAPLRYFDVNDLIMNTIGVVFGLVLYKITKNIEKRGKVNEKN